MTFGARNVIGVSRFAAARGTCRGLLWDSASLPSWVNWLYDMLLGCHLSHGLEFVAAALYYAFLFDPVSAALARGEYATAVAATVAFNLFWEVSTYQVSEVMRLCLTHVSVASTIDSPILFFSFCSFLFGALAVLALAHVRQRRQHDPAARLEVQPDDAV
jgi:hypothetical protein